MHRHAYVFGDQLVVKGEMNMHPRIANGGVRNKRNTF
jgi:hypothetical protein